MTWEEKRADLTKRLGRAPDLNELLALARTHRLTPEEYQAQQQSFVRAEAAFGSDHDEWAYWRAVQNGDGAEIARLDQEALVRVQRVNGFASTDLA